jgi:tRNA(fMet)-specific endonuclease VapC
VRYLLDTDTCIWLLRKKGPVRSRVRGTSPDDLAIASITESELRYGARAGRDEAGDLERIEALLSLPILILPFDSAVARRHAELRYALRSQPIGPADLIIASTAVTYGLVVVTGNWREFARVPGLKVENWKTA